MLFIVFLSRCLSVCRCKYMYNAVCTPLCVPSCAIEQCSLFRLQLLRSNVKVMPQIAFVCQSAFIPFIFMLFGFYFLLPFACMSVENIHPHILSASILSDAIWVKLESEYCSGRVFLKWGVEWRKTGRCARIQVSATCTHNWMVQWMCTFISIIVYCVYVLHVCESEGFWELWSLLVCQWLSEKYLCIALHCYMSVW